MKYYWVNFIDDFLYEKSVNEGLSPKTLECYKTSFNLLFLNKYVDIEDFSTFTEINFKRMLWDAFLSNNWSSNTYNRYRKELKTFCDYLLKNGFLISNPFDNIEPRKLKKNLPKALNLKQVKELFNTIENTFFSKDFLSIRNKTIFYYYIYTWCRLSELIKLKFSDLDFLNKVIRINQWKWNKDRLVPLTNDLSDILIKYLIKKNESWIFTNLVFPTKNWRELQKRDIYSLVKKLKVSLSFDFTPHMLRHTFATELLRKELDIYKISRVLWHSNVKTTQIYLWLNLNDVSKKLDTVSLYR